MANRGAKLTPDDALEAERSIDSFYLFDETSEGMSSDSENAEDELSDEDGAVRLRYVIDENDVVHKERIA